MNGLVNIVMRCWNGDVLLEALAESERSLLCQSRVSPGSFYTLDWTAACKKPDQAVFEP
jgi:hypothetical protein